MLHDLLCKVWKHSFCRIITGTCVDSSPLRVAWINNRKWRSKARLHSEALDWPYKRINWKKNAQKTSHTFWCIKWTETQTTAISAASNSNTTGLWILLMFFIILFSFISFSLSMHFPQSHFNGFPIGKLQYSGSWGAGRLWVMVVGRFHLSSLITEISMRVT